MLRLPQFVVERPADLATALALLAEHGKAAAIIAGGTDLVPNLKHELTDPDVLVSLAGIAELRGIRVQGEALVIGAMTPLSQVARDAHVNRLAPALAQATGLVAGPQIRNMATLGGNVMLDTRCRWYNQSFFWRQALGFCLKKDGDVCHVVPGGQACVAAASNDSVPALMTLGAELVLEGQAGRRSVAIDDFWKADGIDNHKSEDEILVEIRIPQQARGSRGAYGKLRPRGSIDFPQLGIAVRLTVNGDRVDDADVVAVALAARPLRLRGVAEKLAGTHPGQPDFDAAVDEVAANALRKLHPLDNIPGDAQWRQAMVRVQVRRTLHAAANGPPGQMHSEG